MSPQCGTTAARAPLAASPRIATLRIITFVSQRQQQQQARGDSSRLASALSLCLFLLWGSRRQGQGVQRGARTSASNGEARARGGVELAELRSGLNRRLQISQPLPDRNSVPARRTARKNPGFSHISNAVASMRNHSLQNLVGRTRNSVCHRAENHGEVVRRAAACTNGAEKFRKPRGPSEKSDG